MKDYIGDWSTGEWVNHLLDELRSKDMAKTGKCITTGNISDEAAAWLLAHECMIEKSLGLSIISVHERPEEES